MAVFSHSKVRKVSPAAQAIFAAASPPLGLRGKVVPEEVENNKLNKQKRLTKLTQFKIFTAYIIDYQYIMKRWVNTKKKRFFDPAVRSVPLRISYARSPWLHHL